MAKSAENQHVAWLVVYIDPKREPPCICEAGIFAEQKPVKSERHASYSQAVMMAVPGETFETARDRVKEILCEPDWRWIYRVPVLTAGFQHRWVDAQPGSPRRCSTCGVTENNMQVRMSLSSDPDRCLVSHRGSCSSCGQPSAILAGDSLCGRCRFPSK